MSEESKKRTEFEEWFSDGGTYRKAIERKGDDYKLLSAQSAWRTWRAAWACRESELEAMRKDAPSWTVEQEAQIRLEVERLRAADAFEARVQRLQALIERGHKFDFPFTDAFDDGGVAYHEAKRRIEAKAPDA